MLNLSGEITLLDNEKVKFDHVRGPLKIAPVVEKVRENRLR